MSLDLASNHVVEGDAGMSGCYLEPFLVVDVGAERRVSDYACLGSSFWGAFDWWYSFNVPDDVATLTLSITFTAYEYDSNTARNSLALKADGSNVYTYIYAIPDAPNSAVTIFPYEPSSVAPRIDYLSVHVYTFAPTRNVLYLVVPDDFAGIYNVTVSGGATAGRRYVGEPRFVALTVQEQFARGTGVIALYLIPRSIFFETKFADLLERQALPDFGLKFSENGTTSTNSDALQTVFSTRLMPDGISALKALFLQNVTGNASFRWIQVDAYLPVLGLPDDAIRLAGYRPFSHGLTRNYTWGIDESAPVTKPWSIWEMIWNGIVEAIDQVLTYIESAIVFVATIVDAIVRAIGQFGSWFSQVVSQAAQAVASAVEAAGEMFNQFINWVIPSALSLLESLLPKIDNRQVVGALGLSALDGNQSLGPTAGPSLVDIVLSGWFFYLLVGVGLTLQIVATYLSLQSFGAAVALKGLLVPKVVDAIIRVLMKNLIKAALVAIATEIAIAAILYLAVPQSDPFWREGVGLSVLALALSIEKRVLANQFLAADPTRTGRELVGFAISIIGLIVSIGVPGLWGAALGLILAGVGLAITWSNGDIFDLNPTSPLSAVEEVVSLMATSYGVANLAREVSAQ